MKKVAIIGAGFSGLSTACYLSKKGYQVDIYEKNETHGGRARQFKTNDGFMFDMGPSWYWMPEVFDNFFKDFNCQPKDFYDLIRLDPAYSIVYKNDETIQLPDNVEETYILFEQIEKGSAKQLELFLKEAKTKYQIAMGSFVQKPSLSISEFINFTTLKGAFKLELFSSLSSLVRKHFKHPKLIALMEFPVLFLGAMPQEIPAMYSFMNYAGIALGTFYPLGGFGKITDAMLEIALQQRTKIYYNSQVQQITLEGNKAKGLIVNNKEIKYDIVVASSDYHHTENQLLPNKIKNYKESYWEKQTLAPSCLIFYIGLNKQVDNLKHHTLFFDEDLYQHSLEIYKQPQWPTKPLFYVCCPSKTDKTVAPLGHENLFILIPIAPNLTDDNSIREHYFSIIWQRLENYSKQELKSAIVYKRSYCVNDFINDYNAYKGNAYGLANTLMQTAFMKPKLKNKKLDNLYYTGQLTVPGPGVPPSIISGKIVANLIHQSEIK